MTYQSTIRPLPGIGNCGDLWLTTTDIYVKGRDVTDPWSKWSRNGKWYCPYEPQRKLVWTKNADLRYVGNSKNDAFGWKSEFVYALKFMLALMHTSSTRPGW